MKAWTDKDGRIFVAGVEVVPADEHRGAVEALRAARDELGRAPLRDHPTPTVKASKIIGDALDRFGGG